MDQLVLIFKALSDRNRLRVVAALMEYEELCACQITELLQVTGATASRHMGVLLSSGLIESRKDGRWVYYRLCKESASSAALLDWVKNELKKSSDAVKDKKQLEEIMAYEPEELCRKQRGEKCCPNE